LENSEINRILHKQIENMRKMTMFKMTMIMAMFAVAFAVACTNPSATGVTPTDSVIVTGVKDTVAEDSATVTLDTLGTMPTAPTEVR
jgi:hypothetical protein